MKKAKDYSPYVNKISKSDLKTTIREMLEQPMLTDDLTDALRERLSPRLKTLNVYGVLNAMRKQGEIVSRGTQGQSMTWSLTNTK